MNAHSTNRQNHKSLKIKCLPKQAKKGAKNKKQPQATAEKIIAD